MERRGHYYFLRRAVTAIRRRREIATSIRMSNACGNDRAKIRRGTFASCESFPYTVENDARRSMTLPLVNVAITISRPYEVSRSGPERRYRSEEPDRTKARSRTNGVISHLRSARYFTIYPWRSATLQKESTISHRHGSFPPTGTRGRAGIGRITFSRAAPAVNTRCRYLIDKTPVGANARITHARVPNLLINKSIPTHGTAMRTEFETSRRVLRKAI